LVNHFLNKYNNKYKASHSISQQCLDVMVQYPWPGNVRELENTVERLVVIVQDTVIDEEHLPKVFFQAQESESLLQFPQPVPLQEAITQVEKNLIKKAYKELGSSYEVAKVLKTSQSKASRLIRKYCKDHSKPTHNESTLT
jgi:transcriptional regulator with PAS, ATPase and Fis domain